MEISLDEGLRESSTWIADNGVSFFSHEIVSSPNSRQASPLFTIEVKTCRNNLV